MNKAGNKDRLSQSYCHRGGSTPLLGDTIPQHFAQIVTRFPDNEAVVSLPQQRRYTYLELKEEVDRLALGLHAMGYQRGDRIGIWSTNNIEWLLLQMATASIGVILVNINPAYRLRELAYALQRSEVQGLFLIPRFRRSNYVDMILELLPELAEEGEFHNEAFPQLRHVVLYDPEQPEKTASPGVGFALWQDVLLAGKSHEQSILERLTAGLDFDDPINIQYTSGTTGFPKAVILTHHNILNNAWFSARAMHLTERDRLCVPVPFYHCFGMVLANLLCLSVGACIVIACEHFEPGLVLKAVNDEACTAIHGVPTMFIAQLEHPDFTRYDLTSLRTGIMAGAPCAPALMRRVIDEMHCRQILIGYGETEASPLTHLTDPEDDITRRTETVGTNLPHQEVKVVSTEDGHTVAIEEVGEICFRGYHVMRGYYSQPEKTAEAIDKAGWLHSGDLGTMDAEGYVRITGRLKEMIIRGGENIYPREIEEFLFTLPEVSQAAVFGIPDERWGEEVCAWIQLHPGATMTAEEIRELSLDRIAHYKIPKYIRFVDEFPMTVTGKLQKFRMRELMIEGMNGS